MISIPKTTSDAWHRCAMKYIVEPFIQALKQICDCEQSSTSYIYFIGIFGSIHVCVNITRPFIYMPKKIRLFHFDKAKNPISFTVFLYGISFLACSVGFILVSDTPEVQWQWQCFFCYGRKDNCVIIIIPSCTLVFWHFELFNHRVPRWSGGVAVHGIVGALYSGARGPGSSHGRRHCVVFFGKCLSPAILGNSGTTRRDDGIFTRERYFNFNLSLLQELESGALQLLK